MEYFVEQAATHRDAEQKVRMKYGDQARIMHHRSVRVGGFLGLFTREAVEVTGYFSSEPRRPAPVVVAPGSAMQGSVPATGSRGAGEASSESAGSRQPVPSKHATGHGPSGRTLEEEKKRLLEVMRGGDKTLDTVLEEIRSLRKTIDGNAGGDAHPVITEVRDRLEQNDFSPSYIRSLTDRMRRELTVDELSDRTVVHERVVQWIGDSIRLHEPRSTGKPEVFILVGPTGVGKTTTIAKLAAMYGLERNRKARNIRVLTIDNYRIGARQQIETYGQIMDIPVSFVESAEDMRKYLALYQDADMIFVDTIGKSPRDFRKLGEMNELLSICGNRARVHLAMSATTKTCDVAEIATQFEPFKYEAVVVTKMDETTRAGNIISVLSEREKPISFITDGQRVPQDIERATRMRLLMHLEGFDVSRAVLEKHFSAAS